MTISERAVAVRQLPATLNAEQRRMFLRDVRDSMTADRPRMVIDCSSLRQLDNSVAYLLLCCLEEAMKRNGDVKLAGLPPGAGVALKLNRAGRLFDVYDTADDAVDSFHQLPSGPVPPASGTLGSHSGPETAA